MAPPESPGLISRSLFPDCSFRGTTRYGLCRCPPPQNPAVGTLCHLTGSPPPPDFCTFRTASDLVNEASVTRRLLAEHPSSIFFKSLGANHFCLSIPLLPDLPRRTPSIIPQASALSTFPTVNCSLNPFLHSHPADEPLCEPYPVDSSFILGSPAVLCRDPLPYHF